LLHLLSPLRKQGAPFLPDKQCEFIKIIDDLYYVGRFRFIKARWSTNANGVAFMEQIAEWCAVEVSNL
jgi:hypothetical protein